MVSISGIFSVTFSVVFAYVADITTDEDRGQAYGLVNILFSRGIKPPHPSSFEPFNTANYVLLLY